MDDVIMGTCPHGLKRCPICETDPIETIARLNAEIERLRADNERLRAALRDIAEDDIYLRNCATWHDTGKMKTGVQAFARAALENK